MTTINQNAGTFQTAWTEHLLRIDSHAKWSLVLKDNATTTNNNPQIYS